jgi:hypothetical protein
LDSTPVKQKGRGKKICKGSFGSASNDLGVGEWADLGSRGPELVGLGANRVLLTGYSVAVVIYLFV